MDHRGIKTKTWLGAQINCAVRTYFKQSLVSEEQVSLKQRPFEVHSYMHLKPKILKQKEESIQQT